MNFGRINCAHNIECTWFRMIQHVKRAVRVTSINYKVYMDLAGPKIRTVISMNSKMHIEERGFIYLAEEDKTKDEKTDIGCTVPGVAEQLNYGEMVLFDDGMIETSMDIIEHNRVKTAGITNFFKKNTNQTRERHNTIKAGQQKDDFFRLINNILIMPS